MRCGKCGVSTGPSSKRKWGKCLHLQHIFSLCFCRFDAKLLSTSKIGYDLSERVLPNLIEPCYAGLRFIFFPVISSTGRSGSHEIRENHVTFGLSSVRAVALFVLPSYNCSDQSVEIKLDQIKCVKFKYDNVLFVSLVFGAPPPPCFL